MGYNNAYFHVKYFFPQMMWPKWTNFFHMNHNPMLQFSKDNLSITCCKKMDSYDFNQKLHGKKFTLVSRFFFKKKKEISGK
jgi:hypothetical protein